MMDIELSQRGAYQSWLADLKGRIQAAQLKAAVRVNTELILVYWQLGKEIVAKQQEASWGEALIDQLSKDLSSAFPEMKGFSRTNLFYIKKWYLFYSPAQEVVPQLTKQLSGIAHLDLSQELVPQAVGLIPWGHNREIVTKCLDVKEALFYVSETIRYGWSRAVLLHQMESRLYQRQGQTLNNFALTLPKPQADLATETLKNPYNFDFLTLGPQARERDLEDALAGQVTKFLLELGQGFAYMGRQHRLNINGDDFYLDILLYHTKLRCHVVVELKVTEFQPEFAGKLNFYLNAVDAQLRQPGDNSSIGILLCKTPNRVVVEYSLRNMSAPLGVAEYRLLHAVPEELKGELPTIEDLEQELEKGIPAEESPLDLKIRQLKGLLNSMESEEVQKGKDKESILWIFGELLPRLEALISKSLGEVIPLFKDFWLTRRVNSTSKADYTIGDLEETLGRENVNLIGLNIRLEGFKKGGTKAFSIYKDLNFALYTYKYAVGPSQDEIWEERLYHQEWTEIELQKLAAKWCEQVVGDLMLHIERMK
ncbi:PDDEXK nuclease domain-containing protein [Rufibacter ruber]|uniref:PDDEXK nuclease domain-containing protein n=1 Tax=Rufibacter ruber TaxID=1783499 RepID=UPI0008300F78|nr:PDDEXK nuclease domain-containing protein [Rufibacter ruber]